MLDLLIEAGVRHFDCASLPEIELMQRVCPGGTHYFMVPTRIRGAARAAQAEHNVVRHFMVDHLDGVSLLADEIDMSRSVVFAQMAIHHESAMVDLSVRFGEQPQDMPALLQSIRDHGAEAALAFNVGSSVTDPDAYRYAMNVTAEVLANLPFKIRLLGVGGGYPKSYPGFIDPHLDEYFHAVENSIAGLPIMPRSSANLAAPWPHRACRRSSRYCCARTIAYSSITACTESSGSCDTTGMSVFRFGPSAPANYTPGTRWPLRSMARPVTRTTHCRAKWICRRIFALAITLSLVISAPIA